MTFPGGDDARRGPGSAHDRLTAEARATASVLLEWLGSRVDQAAAPGGSGARPAQSPGPCTWCPVCALVAALRGEQPELTARLAEQASGLMMLLRTMMQDHDRHHGHHGPRPDPHFGADLATDGGATPPGWPSEWGDPSWWTTSSTSGAPEPAAGEAAGADGEEPDRSAGDAGPPPRRPRTASAPRPTRRPRRAPRRDPQATDGEAVASEPARATRPGPRRAPAKTTSPRTAAFRPSPRAASMPAADATAPVDGDGAVTRGSDAGRAGSEDAAAPPRAAPEPAADPPAPAAGPSGPRAASRPRSTVQQIAVRRREEPGS